MAGRGGAGVKVMEMPADAGEPKADGAAVLDALAGIVCDFLHERAGEAGTARPDIERARALVRAWAGEKKPHTQ